LVWSFENTSSGGWVMAIFLMFRELTGLVVMFVVPKAIPHFGHAPLVHNHTVMRYLRLVSTKMYIST
jgi:hypothetical protein